MSRRKHPDRRLNNHDWQEMRVKRCYGPLHPIEGHLLPCDPGGESAFHFFKTGARAGKPLSRCKKCQHFKRYGTYEDHGLESAELFMKYYDQIARLIGKAETNRRLGITWSLVGHIRNSGVKNVKHGRATQAHRLLREIQPRNIVLADRSAYLNERYPVKPNDHDRTWWITEYDGPPILRYGEEMLGRDF